MIKIFFWSIIIIVQLLIIVMAFFKDWLVNNSLFYNTNNAYKSLKN